MTKRVILFVLVISMFLVGAGCSAGKKQAKQRPDTRKMVQVKIINFGFEPPEIKVGVNDIVDWENRDSAQHAVQADDAGWRSRPLAQGDHFQKSFKQPGAYAYHCNIHPTMTGTVIVK